MTNNLISAMKTCKNNLLKGPKGKYTTKRTKNVENIKKL